MPINVLIVGTLTASQEVCQAIADVMGVMLLKEPEAIPAGWGPDFIVADSSDSPALESHSRPDARCLAHVADDSFGAAASLGWEFYRLEELLTEIHGADVSRTPLNRLGALKDETIRRMRQRRETLSEAVQKVMDLLKSDTCSFLKQTESVRQARNSPTNLWQCLALAADLYPLIRQEKGPLPSTQLSEETRCFVKVDNSLLQCFLLIACEDRPPPQVTRTRGRVRLRFPEGLPAVPELMQALPLFNSPGGSVVIEGQTIDLFLELDG